MIIFPRVNDNIPLINMAIEGNYFRIKHNDLLPEQGRLLISEPLLRDTYFERAVVLLVEHSDSGSMGFILNKKTELTVNSFFPELDSCEEIPIFVGGPVSANRLFFVHTLGDVIIPDSFPIANNLYFDGDFEAMKTYIISGKPIRGKVKFFLGYSGWTGGQLAREIDGNSWAVGKSDDEYLFSANGDAFWKRSVDRLGNSYRNWNQIPKEPWLN